MAETSLESVHKTVLCRCMVDIINYYSGLPPLYYHTWLTSNGEIYLCYLANNLQPPANMLLAILSYIQWSASIFTSLHLRVEIPASMCTRLRLCVYVVVFVFTRPCLRGYVHAHTPDAQTQVGIFETTGHRDQRGRVF